MELSEHLFRRESGRLVAALTRIFGVHNLALAEDVVQDAFCRALEVWKVRGVPDNPSAWLMAVARRIARWTSCARNAPRGRSHPSSRGPRIGMDARADGRRGFWEARDSGRTAEDDVLLLSSSAARGRAGRTRSEHPLRLRSGRNRQRLSDGRADMEKRIGRGKKVLAGAKRLFDLSDAEFGPRLSAVRRALYLLFNEGYHGASAEPPVRAELCGEAIRLTKLLLEIPAAAQPDTYALTALMSLHAARLPARIDATGDLSPLLEQDRIAVGRTSGEEGLACSIVPQRVGRDLVSSRGGDCGGPCGPASRTPIGRPSSSSTTD